MRDKTDHRPDSLRDSRGQRGRLAFPIVRATLPIAFAIAALWAVMTCLVIDVQLLLKYVEALGMAVVIWCSG